MGEREVTMTCNVPHIEQPENHLDCLFSMMANYLAVEQEIEAEVRHGEADRGWPWAARYRLDRARGSAGAMRIEIVRMIREGFPSIARQIAEEEAR